MQYVRWQVVTPRSLFAISAQGGIAGDLVAPIAWWRTNTITPQSAFETWVGGSHQPSVESIGQVDSFRQYGFASVGGDRASVFFVGGSLLVLAASAVAIAIGLLLLYVPYLRHPVVLVALSLLLLVLALSWPALALLSGQSIVLALMVILVCRLVQVPFVRRRRNRRTRGPSPPSSVIRVRPSTRIRTDVALSTPSTTANAVPSMPIGTSELA